MCNLTNDIICYVGMAFFVFAAVMCFLRECHMFQLNSYHALPHLKWITKNISDVSANLFAIGFGALSVFAALRLDDCSIYLTVLYACFALVFILVGLSDVPKKKAKTPLVFTARVKRMFITYLVLVLIIVGVSLIMMQGANYKYTFTVLLFGYALLPLILLIANLINAPVEAAVRRYYLNDAKKILRSCPDLKVIGITGSYGKTSMKFFLSEIMKQKYNVLIPPKNFNTPMGIVKTIRSELRGYHEYFICEMGAKKLGEIKELCDIVHPENGILTSIGPQHLESFKSIENIITTKFELYNNLSGGKCFVNLDNEYIRDNLPDDVITYGTVDGASYRGKVISVSRKGTTFSVTYPDGTEHTYTANLLGSHNVVNLCGAIAAAKHFGVSDEEIEEGISRITPVPHRLEMTDRGGITVIDDAYNSNPNGCRAALEVLGYFDYKILVTPGMVELGEKEEELNREFGTEAAEVCDFVILVGEKQTRPILAGLRDKGYPEEKIYVAETLGDAMNKVYSIETDKKKAVLLENDLPDNY